MVEVWLKSLLDEVILRQHQRRRNLLGSPKLALVPASGFCGLFLVGIFQFTCMLERRAYCTFKAANQTIADLLLYVNDFLQQKLMSTWVLSYIMQLLSAQLLAQFDRVARPSATAVSSSLDGPGFGKNR